MVQKIRLDCHEVYTVHPFIFFTQSNYPLTLTVSDLESGSDRAEKIWIESQRKSEGVSQIVK